MPCWSIEWGAGSLRDAGPCRNPVKTSKELLRAGNKALTIRNFWFDSKSACFNSICLVWFYVVFKSIVQSGIRRGQAKSIVFVLNQVEEKKWQLRKEMLDALLPLTQVGSLNKWLNRIDGLIGWCTTTDFRIYRTYIYVYYRQQFSVVIYIFAQMNCTSAKINISYLFLYLHIYYFTISMYLFRIRNCSLATTTISLKFSRSLSPRKIINTLHVVRLAKNI